MYAVASYDSHTTAAVDELRRLYEPPIIQAENCLEMTEPFNGACSNYKRPKLT